VNLGELNNLLTTIFSGIVAVMASVAAVMTVLLKIKQAERAKQEDENTDKVTQAARKVDDLSLNQEAAHNVINQKLNTLVTAADLNQATTDSVHELVRDIKEEGKGGAG
jgi:hypothetical protein